MSNLRDDLIAAFDATMSWMSVFEHQELKDMENRAIGACDLISEMLCRDDFRNKSEATKAEYPLGHRVTTGNYFGEYSIYTQFADGSWSDHEEV